MRLKRQIIRQHRPVRKLIVAIIGVVTIGASAYALYVGAGRWAQDELSALHSERDELLTTANPEPESDAALFSKLGLEAGPLGSR